MTSSILTENWRLLESLWFNPNIFWLIVMANVKIYLEVKSKPMDSTVIFDNLIHIFGSNWHSVLPMKICLGLTETSAESSVRPYSLSETTTPPVCQKVRPKFGLSLDIYIHILLTFLPHANGNACWLTHKKKYYVTCTLKLCFRSTLLPKAGQNHL